MGGCGEKEEKKKGPLNKQLMEEYKLAGLPDIDKTQFKSELEKEVFVAINMIRHNPS